MAKMVKNYLNAIFLLLVGQYCMTYVSGYSSYYSYHTNSIDDGNKVVTKIAAKHYDSRRSLQPNFDQRIIIEPSKSRYTTNHLINQRQLLTNNVGTGLDTDLLDHPVFMQPISDGYRNRGFFSANPRSVELPPLAVDSQGRASSTSVANELAKLLHIRQGYYSELYDKMNKPANQPIGTTKRPVDAVEDAVRDAVVRLYRAEQNQRKHKDLKQ